MALGCLVFAANKTVDSLVGLARIYEIPDALIAMSVIAIGTSLPEIGSHVIASLGILSGQLNLEVISFTVIGGNMGSSTVQQLLLVGILFFGIGEREYSKRFFIDTYVPMLLTFVILFGLAYDGLLSPVDGLILLVIFAGFMVISYQYRARNVEVSDSEEHNPGWDLTVSIVGFAVVVVSAFFSLKFVEILVERMGLNGSMAGVLSIGFAAALPEFSTVVESIRRKSPYLALGTLIGSNVVNPLVGIGSGAVISTYVVPPSLLAWDLPFKFGVGLVLLAWVYLWKKRRAGLWEGFGLIVAYFIYLSVRMMFFS